MDDDTPTQLQQDLAATARDLGGALRDVRHHVQARVVDLDRLSATHLAEAGRLLAQQRPAAAADQLQRHVTKQETLLELRRVLSLLW